MVGSANLNRRSWTHDSGRNAVLDQERGPRPPVDPGGLGDGAGYSPVNSGSGCGGNILRLGPDGGEPALLDPVAGFELWRATAARLEGWHDGGNRGPRPRPGPAPPGGLASALEARWAAALYRVAID